jgi:hypothetical protein
MPPLPAAPAPAATIASAMIAPIPATAERAEIRLK